MVALTAPAIVSTRYRLLDQLGAGGMGSVYRALDRLTGTEVALKRVSAVTGQSETTLILESLDLRLSLAYEFQSLSSLRHPHIISVLDYGFDSDRQPYYTMELLENAKTILQAGQGQPLTAQAQLLVEMLQALVYLHRRGVIHRDLKPANVLVGSHGVKVLDFGLASADNQEENSTTSGTLAYMAPEIISGESAQVKSDLYAVGVMAYEMFVGHHPYDLTNIAKLVQDILNTPPDLTSVNLDSEISAILGRLLAKHPEDRYASAIDVIHALSTALSLPLPVETSATRESFLQAARLVGRDAELTQLTASLKQLMKGQGAAWLLSGESGVGKSRLMDEIRTRSLIEGALVMRGQAVSEGSSPYQLWRDPARWLALSSDLGIFEASVLKTLVPDISELLGREIPDAPELDVKAAQVRLLTVFTQLIRKQTQPVVLILEDLHWAGSDTLELLTWVLQLVPTMPLYIVASYREEEAPTLLDSLGSMQHMRLQRLSEQGIAELSASMLGEVGRQPEVLSLLQHETEGNVFFLVEVVRALAEEAGQLDKIADMTLPKHVFAGGIRQVVERRLNRVQPSERPLLEFAAVVGRQLDLDVLEAADKTADLENWLTDCADAGILDVHEGSWRFAHDKLRDGLLAKLSDGEKQTLNRLAAQLIEKIHPNAPEQLVALAYHWSIAGDKAKEAYYTALAGEQAAHTGALQKAINLLKRAVELYQELPPDVLRQAALERQLGEAYYALGNLSESKEHLKKSLALLRWPLPENTSKLGMSLFANLMKQMLHRFIPARQDIPMRNCLLEGARGYERLGQIYFIGNEALPAIYSAIRGLNLAEVAGPSAELARSYATMGGAAAVVPLRSVANLYSRLAEETAKKINDPAALAWMLTLRGYYDAGAGKWEESRKIFEQAISIYDQVGDRRKWEECRGLLSPINRYLGDFEAVLKINQQTEASARQRGDVQIELLGILGRVDNLLAMGRLDEALENIENGLGMLKKGGGTSEEVWTYSSLGLIRLYNDQFEAAYEAANIASERMGKSLPTTVYAFEGYAAIPAIYLALCEHRNEQKVAEPEALLQAAKKGCKLLQSYARIFALGQPRAWLYQGLYEWLTDKPSQAQSLWQKSLAAAQRLGMPLEQGLAHYEIGRHLPANDPARKDHLTQAQQLFSKIKAAYFLEKATGELNR